MIYSTHIWLLYTLYMCIYVYIYLNIYITCKSLHANHILYIYIYKYLHDIYVYISYIIYICEKPSTPSLALSAVSGTHWKPWNVYFLIILINFLFFCLFYQTMRLVLKFLLLSIWYSFFLTCKFVLYKLEELVLPAYTLKNIMCSKLTDLWDFAMSFFSKFLLILFVLTLLQQI